MVKYTLDNIEGVVFNYHGEIYKIHKEKGKIEELYENGASKALFEYSSFFSQLVEHLNNGLYKVISQPERIIELW